MKWSRVRLLRDNHAKTKTKIEGDFVGGCVYFENDIEEEKENIKEFLWKEFSGELLRTARSGFPEWYKKKLVEESF
ncbi:MAG: hypothetical protein IPM48_14685 [Saprospiraceae bacterium]|nr:hypothetical protein [Saprospiraceae bacterium]